MHCHCTTCTHDVHKPHTFIPLRQCFQGLGPLQRGHTHPALLNFLQISFYSPLYLSNLVKVYLTIIFSYAKWKSNCSTLFSFSKISDTAIIFWNCVYRNTQNPVRKESRKSQRAILVLEWLSSSTVAAGFPSFHGGLGACRLTGPLNNERNVWVAPASRQPLPLRPSTYFSTTFMTFADVVAETQLRSA